MAILSLHLKCKNIHFGLNHFHNYVLQACYKKKQINLKKIKSIFEWHPDLQVLEHSKKDLISISKEINQAFVQIAKLGELENALKFLKKNMYREKMDFGRWKI